MNISDFNQCSNCGACYNICPKKAINVKKDSLFYYPTVDENLCVNCSLCVHICPVNNAIEKNEPIYACAGWHRDNNIVLDSSSGGMFHGIAEGVLSKGGVVFSAAFSDDNKSVHIVSSDEVSLDKIRKSKYVESVIGDSFGKIKENLSEGRLVLFCGTPCQVAGLYRYLGEKNDLLITCDFACGGLPSHAIYKDYLEELERKYRSSVKKVDFRPKSHGWERHAIWVEFDNGKVYNRLGTEDPYLRSFLYGKYTVRDCCLECKFSDNHLSDITIADFWRYKELSDLKHEDGISLLLCNTLKGRQVVDNLKDCYYLVELDVEKAAYNNKIKKSNKISEHRAFLNCYVKNGLKVAYKTFVPNSFKNKIKSYVARKVLRKKGI